MELLQKDVPHVDDRECFFFIKMDNTLIYLDGQIQLILVHFQKWEVISDGFESRLFKMYPKYLQMKELSHSIV